MTPHEADGEAHYVEVTALDPVNEARGETLNGVGSGLVHRFARLGIGRAILWADFEKSNECRLAIYEDFAASPEADTGQNLVRLSRKQRQHRQRVVDTGWLLQDLPAQVNGCVGGQNYFSGLSLGRHRLLPRQTLYIFRGRFARLVNLGNRRGADGEADSRLTQDLGTARGSRGKNDHQDS